MVVDKTAETQGIVQLTNGEKNDILKQPCSRGSSGALYLQSALVGVMFYGGL